MPPAPAFRIGNQTAFAAPSLLEPFHYAVQNGFDAFEWFPDKKPWGGWDESHLDAPARDDIRRTASACHIRLSVHARWQANPLQAGSWPILLRDIELAEDLGAALLNVHLYTEEGVETYVRAITPLIRRVAETGLQLAIENTPLTTPQHFNELFARLHALGDAPTGHVGMCLDLGHANLCATTRNDFLRYLDELDARVPLIHLHVHENWGDRDSHLPLFTGPAGRDDAGVRGFIDRMLRRNYSGSAILEQWPQPPWLLNQARERFKYLLHEGAKRLRPEQGQGEPQEPAVALHVAPVAVSLSPSEGERAGVRGPPQRPDSPNASPDAEDDFVQLLVSANQRCRSWREKLDFIRGLFADDERELATGQLIDLAIYLRFLGTGEIPCAEDGRHFRPSHHAKISAHIQKRLARLATPENAFILRNIHPWLPSSGREFTRAEPLTRIRDLAHRNDIPSDLKREIKHTLQNKLHRCAGPEDLATSAALLARLAAPGAGYSAAFVEEFKMFHAELEEFFNARSLDERLQAVARGAGADEADLIRRFLKEKKAIAAESVTALLTILQTLLALRRRFLAQIAENPEVETQELLLADIGLEDFSFVLLSGLNNAVEAPMQDVSWAPLLEALALTLAGLALSGVAPEECHAIESEFSAWRRDFDPRDREQLLRLKASTDRARRLAEDFSNRVLELFARRAEKLGRALGVAEHAVRVFSDAEIRGHVVFQLSKFASTLLRHIRDAAALPHWDVLVGGRAVGRCKVMDSLDEFSESLSRPVIALLRHAEGDEEIPRSVAGIVLAHELPHLSHLGVRARQAGVVFVVCEESAKFAKLTRLAGSWIALDATPEKVTMEVAGEPQRSPSNPTTTHRLRVPEISLNPSSPWLPLTLTTPENAGGKAAGARRLEQLSQRKGVEFKTPPGLVILFGVMENGLRAAPAIQAEYEQWLRRVGEPDGLDLATENLRRLVLQLDVPGEVARVVAEKFGADARLMVRSSANCEDLENLSGAGLYDSVANVAPVAVASAVREVWASLWTRRATASRQQAGWMHGQAHIAVLIQRMVAPDLSFIMHTVNPVNRRADEAYVELAVGLGETLASAATRGIPWRLVCDKRSGKVATLAFANFSGALWPNPAGGLTRRTVDYSEAPLSRDAVVRRQLGARLAEIARVVEDEFGRPQDIEGVIAGEDVYLVQSRPQHGIG